MKLIVKEFEDGLNYKGYVGDKLVFEIHSQRKSSDEYLLEKILPNLFIEVNKKLEDKKEKKIYYLSFRDKLYIFTGKSFILHEQKNEEVKPKPKKVEIETIYISKQEDLGLIEFVFEDVNGFLRGSVVQGYGENEAVSYAEACNWFMEKKKQNFLFKIKK